MTANRATPKPKEVSLNGRKYIVAPVVMIKEGVLQGNHGAIFYGAKEVNRRVNRWNYMPVTLGHPEDASGNKISARDNPETIDKYGVGMVFNASFSGDKLKAEAYLDVELMKSKAPAILAKVKKGQPVELSTGLFTNTKQASGEFNGKKYSEKLSAYEPDHLAILASEEGACSLKDGCGVNTNQSEAVDEVPAEQDSDGVTINSLSHDDIKQALRSLLPADENGVARGYVEDVYKDYFVYYREGQLFRQKYKIGKGVISLEGEPQDVVSSKKYKPIKRTESSVTFQANESPAWPSLTTNCGCGCGGNCGKAKKPYRVLDSLDVSFQLS